MRDWKHHRRPGTYILNKATKLNKFIISSVLKEIQKQEKQQLGTGLLLYASANDLLRFSSAVAKSQLIFAKWKCRINKVEHIGNQRSIDFACFFDASNLET